MAGYHTVPLPIAETVLAYGLCARVAGSVPEGPASLAPANDTGRVTIEPHQDGHRPHGTVKRIPWGTNVDNILVFAESTSSDRFLALVPVLLIWGTSGANLASEPRADIVLTGIVLQPDRVRPAPPELTDGLMPFGDLIRAFQIVGAMRRALDLSVKYAGDREQFGRPIAKFQAIRQMLAEAAGHLAAAEAACARVAAEAWGPDGLFFAVNAKARAGEAAGRVAEIRRMLQWASRRSIRCILPPDGFGPGVRSSGTSPTGRRSSAERFALRAEPICGPVSVR